MDEKKRSLDEKRPTVRSGRRRIDPLIAFTWEASWFQSQLATNTKSRPCAVRRRRPRGPNFRSRFERGSDPQIPLARSNGSSEKFVG